MGFGMYILKGRTPVPCEDLITWGKWLQTAERHVAKDTLGECWVSTVFLGLDHNHSRRGPPILFESMAFGPEVTEYSSLFKRTMTHRPEICSMDRYATWEQAAAGHKRIVAEVHRYLLDTAITADEAIQRIAGTLSRC